MATLCTWTFDRAHQGRLKPPTTFETKQVRLTNPNTNRDLQIYRTGLRKKHLRKFGRIWKHSVVGCPCLNVNGTEQSNGLIQIFFSKWRRPLICCFGFWFKMLFWCWTEVDRYIWGYIVNSGFYDLTLSNDDSKTTALHVHHAFKYISLTSTARLRRETSQCDVLCTTWTYYDNFPFSIWTWIKPLRIQLQEKSPTFDELSGSR